MVSLRQKDKSASVDRPAAGFIARPIFAMLLGCSDAFRESLKKLFQTEVPRGEVFIDPTGELWCKLDNITAHLKHGGRGR
jgi:hypothetical protein